MVRARRRGRNLSSQKVCSAAASVRAEIFLTTPAELHFLPLEPSVNPKDASSSKSQWSASV